MDSDNPSSGIAVLLAAVRSRLTGRPDAPEPPAAPQSNSQPDAPPLSLDDLPADTWAHGESLEVPMPRADLIAKMSEEEQAAYWRDWAAQVERETAARESES